MEKEIVICAALLMPDGNIIRGHRHHDCVRTASMIPRYRDLGHRMDDEGFVTSRNRFVNRKDGYKLQIEAGIKSVLEGTENENGAYLHSELYSEDLY